ncbi:MAG: hypothetical protein AAGA99_01295 [Actinomycetota bacterium]
METEGDPVGRRRIVLHPATAVARQQDRARSFGGHVRGFTVDGDDIDRLMRRQRLGALRVFAVAFVPLMLLPLVFAFAPDAATFRVGDLPPLAWLALGPVALFSIVGLAFVHARRASMREDDWISGHRDGPG